MTSRLSLPVVTRISLSQISRIHRSIRNINTCSAGRRIIISNKPTVSILKGYACKPRATGERIVANAFELAYLASGRSDIFFELLLSPWDIAAGALLLTEAGGKITDFKGTPIDYSKPSPVLATTEKLFAEALEIVENTLGCT